ncbi:apyrase 1-like [Coffea arabica]|uniref:Apyrase 1-like n=1 Tax=Coffea arabica TaxID=13443 RepID=A0ABM4VQT7_COFAR
MTATPGAGSGFAGPDDQRRRQCRRHSTEFGAVSDAYRLCTSVSTSPSAMTRFQGSLADSPLTFASLLIRSFLKNEGSFYYEVDDVAIVDRTQESVYKWITTNYLLGSLGKNCSSSVGVIDLGEEAVQMVYAMSNTNALNAPRTSVGDNVDVLEKYLNGRRYHHYTKRCIPLMFHDVFPVFFFPFCEKYGILSLGLIDRNADAAVIRATDYANEADRACRTKMRDAKSKYRLEDPNLPYICMDLVYLYTILINQDSGKMLQFTGLDPWQEIKLLHQITYQDWLAGPTWPLGYAIDVASSITESQMTA